MTHMTSTSLSASSAAATDAPIAVAQNLKKTYGSDATEVHALAGVDLQINAGELTAIMGPSGSGKSTLMHCLAGLDSPTSGTVQIAGQNIAALNDSALTTFRRDNIGFIFQAFNLIPTLSAAKNITLPLDIAGADVDQEWFDRVIDTVALRDRLDHRPAELSGGQQQRVACARALVSKPAIIFADEPTGNLDSATSADVLSFLKQSVKEFHQTVVMVTHEPSAAAYADRVVYLADGNISGDQRSPSAELILQTITGLIKPEQAPAPKTFRQRLAESVSRFIAGQ